MALFKEIKLTDADRYPHDLKILITNLHFGFLDDFHIDAYSGRQKTYN